MPYRKKEYSPRALEIINKYQEAKIKYSEAARVFTKLRLAAERAGATDADARRYLDARKYFKAEAAAFYKERLEFQFNIQECMRPKPNMDKDVESALRETPDAVVLDRVSDYSHTELQELKKQVLMEEDVKAGKYNELLAKAAKLRGSSREQFTSSENKNIVDPTLGDFDPI